jgi:hypothetical protein
MNISPTAVIACDKRKTFVQGTASDEAILPVIPGWCASARPGISRFSDVQLHIVVRCLASPRNDGTEQQNSQEDTL